MTFSLWLLIPVLVLAMASGISAYLYYKLYNNANGERYLKQRMQGPFVPLSPDELAEGQAQK
jgi:hypothetical protein